MLEPWDEVLTLQKERLQCAEDVQTIKTSCAKEHGKTHVAQCPECWTRLVNRMRDRYINSASKEWFSGRRAFLQELDTMFSKAHQRKLDFKTIEQRIFDEKKEWYRDKVRNLGLHLATKSPAEARALQQRLNDRSMTADQLASELKETFSGGAVQNEEAFNNFIDQLKRAQSPKARTDAYIDVFFQPAHDPAGAAKCKKYIEMVASGIPIADAINAMLRDRQSAKGDQEQKQKLQKKLEELKRAKAAHELDKAKRDQARQEKSRAAIAAAEAETRPHLPSCSVCSQATDPRSCFVCPLCHALSEVYELQKQTTVFCSDACHDEGWETHLSTQHECASGRWCVTVTDEDFDMDESDQVLVGCRECLENLLIPSVFCSSRCYEMNFQRHRDTVHLQARETRRQNISDEHQLEFDPDNNTRYQARKIEDHIVSLDDVLADWQKKTGATLS